MPNVTFESVVKLSIVPELDPVTSAVRPSAQACHVFAGNREQITLAVDVHEAVFQRGFRILVRERRSDRRCPLFDAQDAVLLAVEPYAARVRRGFVAAVRPHQYPMRAGLAHTVVVYVSRAASQGLFAVPYERGARIRREQVLQGDDEFTGRPGAGLLDRLLGRPAVDQDIGIFLFAIDAANLGGNHVRGHPSRRDRVAVIASGRLLHQEIREFARKSVGGSLGVGDDIVRWASGVLRKRGGVQAFIEVRVGCLRRSRRGLARCRRSRCRVRVGYFDGAGGMHVRLDRCLRRSVVEGARSGGPFCLRALAYQQHAQGGLGIDFINLNGKLIAGLQQRVSDRLTLLITKLRFDQQPESQKTLARDFQIQILLAQLAERTVHPQQRHFDGVAGVSRLVVFAAPLGEFHFRYRNGDGYAAG